jgi:hypothetical protein
LKNPSQKRDGGVAQSVSLEFKSQCHKKKISFGYDYCAPATPRQLLSVFQPPGINSQMNSMS